MVFSLGPNAKNRKEEILYNWPSSDNTLVRRHVIQNEYYEVDSKVTSFQIHQSAVPVNGLKYTLRQNTMVNLK